MMNVLGLRLWLLLGLVVVLGFVLGLRLASETRFSTAAAIRPLWRKLGRSENC